MEDNSKQSCPEQTITTPKHLRSSTWKYFEFYTVDGKVTNKGKAVCRLHKGQLSYSSTTRNLQARLLAYHPTEAEEAEAEGSSDTIKETTMLIQLFRK